MTLILISLSTVVLDECEKVEFVTSSFSVPQPVIVPVEREVSSGLALMHEFYITCGFTGNVTFESDIAVDKYTPDIMEQINIISVAPRE